MPAEPPARYIFSPPFTRSSRHPSFIVSRRCSSSVRPCDSRRMPRTGLVRCLLSAPVLDCFPGGLSILRGPLHGAPMSSLPFRHLLDDLRRRGFPWRSGFRLRLGLGLTGFREPSPVFRSVEFDDGLPAESYMPLNLAGSGTRSRKVAPSARFCGGTGSLWLCPWQLPRLSPRVRGEQSGEIEAGAGLGAVAEPLEHREPVLSRQV